jgi:hypothetical protein
MSSLYQSVEKSPWSRRITKTFCVLTAACLWAIIPSFTAVNVLCCTFISAMALYYAFG